MSNDTVCWCHEAHPDDPADILEAWPKLWHEVVAALRIPSLVAWLSKKVS